MYLFPRPAADADADDLVIGDIGGGVTDVIPLIAEVDFGTGEVVPQFSPDGTRIAVELGFIYEVEEPFQVLDREGEAILELTGVLGSAWTPDGQLVLTGQPGSAEVPGVYLVDVDGTGQLLREFPEYEGSPTRPAVSPDGTQVAYTYEGHVYLLPLAGGEHEQLTIGRTTEGEPAWSPDGRSVAFARDSPGSCPELWVVPADAGLTDVQPADEFVGVAFRPIDDAGDTVCAFTHIDWR